MATWREGACVFLFYPANSLHAIGLQLYAPETGHVHMWKKRASWTYTAMRRWKSYLRASLRRVTVNKVQAFERGRAPVADLKTQPIGVLGCCAAR
jgi:hypothetical protein